MIVGIDLGTTNCAIGMWRDGVSTLIPNALGTLLTPSAVSVSDKGEILTGQAALDRRTTDPECTATAFKRYIGTQHKVKLGRNTFTAEDLSAMVLRSLKADAEALWGEEVTDAVVTVPAYFNDRQRKATRRAAQLAGLQINRLLNEPTAAALAFGMHDKGDREPFLVFDLGGGTFDVSIVEMFDGVVEVRASAGDNRLGGEDFNEALIMLARDRLNQGGLLDRAHPLIVREKLNAAAESCRRALSDFEEAEFSLVIDGEKLSATVTGTEFEAQCAGLIARLREPVLRALRDSNIQVESLSDIVLVGGATRMPIVRRAITKMFGRFPSHLVHPDHAVALGAGIQAGLLMRDAALDEIRMTDICPFTLGIEHVEFDRQGRMHHGLFSPIIERNTAIPASRMGIYSTVQDNQRKIQVNIYQGEARLVVDNVKLGEIMIPLPPRPAGELSINCRFSYDTSGLLEVDVNVPATGAAHNLVIVDDADAPSADDVEKRRRALAALKVHPREEAENVALLARAGKCYEGFIGEAREAIGQWITAFEVALDSQDTRIIADSRKEIAKRLDALEGERIL